MLGCPDQTGVGKKNTPPEKTLVKIKLSEQQFREWRAGSAAALHGQGSHVRSECSFPDIGVSVRNTPPELEASICPLCLGPVDF